MQPSRRKFGTTVKAQLVKFGILLSLSLVSAVLFGVNRASADTIEVFSLSGTFADSSTVSGTLTIDVTDGLITAAHLTYGGQTYADILLQQAFFGGTNSGQTPVPVDYEVNVGTTSASLPRLDFGIAGTSAIDSLIGYTGGTLASLDALGGPDQQGTLWYSAFHAADGSDVALQSGKLVATPEPSTLFLLGAALLGLALSLLKQPRAQHAAA